MRRQWPFLAIVTLLAVSCGAPAQAPDAASGQGSVPPASPVGRDGAPAATAATSDGGSASDRTDAPGFTMTTLDGGTFALAEALGHGPVVLNFWAPW